MLENIASISAQLSDEQAELMNLIGADAYKKLVENYGGCSIYICHPDTLDRLQRNRQIFSEFNGNNYRELAKKYRLSENAIRNIITEMLKTVS